MSISVLLADDHKILREGLKFILRNETDIEIVGEAENGREAVELAKQLLPNLVVMDLLMPEMLGMEAIHQITAECPTVRVLVLSMHSEKRLVVEALNAGANGYLLKDCASEELVAAIRTLSSNEAYLSPRVASLIVRNCIRMPVEKECEGSSPLSRREVEVLKLLVEGKNTKHIAYILDLSSKTVEAHRQNIMKKLDLSSVAELTKYAIKEGITTL